MLVIFDLDNIFANMKILKFDTTIEYDFYDNSLLDLDILIACR
jgi:hypothetical protein